MTTKVLGCAATPPKDELTPCRFELIIDTAPFVNEERPGEALERMTGR